MPDELRVLGFYALAAGEPTGDPPRSRVQLMQAGSFSHPRYGKFTITAEDLASFAESIRTAADGGAATPIDYDHSFAERGDSRAAGWIEPDTAVVEGDALWATVQWTLQAAIAIRDKEYRFISPEFSFAERDRTTGKLVKRPVLMAAALTNRPFLRDMAPVQLSARGLADLFSSPPKRLTAEETATLEARTGAAAELVLRCLSADEPELRQLAEQLATEKEAQMPDLKAVAGALSLSEDADEATILAAITTNAEAAARVPDLETQVKDLGEKVLPQDVIARLTASAAKGEDAARKLHDLERNTLLDEAVRDGKILPVQKDSFVAMFDTNPEQVKELLDATPAKSFAEKGSGGEGPVTPAAKGSFKSNVDGTEYEADDASLELHEKAVAVLAADGKGDRYTEDDYVRAVARAQAA